MREVNHAQGQQLASARAHMEAQAIAQGEQLASVRAHMESGHGCCSPAAAGRLQTDVSHTVPCMSI